MVRPPVNFVTVDFETANAHRASACSVGLTKVEQGQITQTTSWLIKPHESVSDFHPMNISIHGITPSMVEQHGITWHDTHARMTDFVGNSPVVAHNSGFDRSVWNHANLVAGIPELAPDFYCTLSLSRRLARAGHLTGINNFRLDTLAHHFGIQQNQHHEAGEDSLIAAHIALELMSLMDVATIQHAWGAPTSYGAIRGTRIPQPKKIRQIINLQLFPQLPHQKVLRVRHLP